MPQIRRLHRFLLRRPHAATAALLLPVLLMSDPISAAPLSVAPLNLPPVNEQTLPNGLSVVTVERHDLPLVAMRLLVPTGAGRDPEGKAGLASMTGSLLRRGTASRNSEQIDDAIESVGGLLGVDVGYETTTLASTVPSEHAATALEVIADLVRHPSFPEAEYETAKRLTLAHLRNDLDDPSTVADRALVEFFYGQGHPYGSPVNGRTASVSSFTRDDVVRFHRDTYTPHRALLIFVGDIDATKARELATKVLGDWTGVKTQPLTIAPPTSSKGVEILLVDKPDATQAQVRVAVPGLSRRDPRFFSAAMANTIVGGGFTSRLVDEVRVNRGLSYAVSTRVVALREFGAITYSTFTKTETVREILDVSFGVLDEFRAEGPTDEELDKAKRFVVGLYPSRVESIEGLAEALGAARILGLPFESISEYRTRIAEVPLERVKEAAKLYPSTSAARIVVVGNAVKIRPQLEGLGTVTIRKAVEFE